MEQENDGNKRSQRNSRLILDFLEWIQAKSEDSLVKLSS
jgi:hypothetical protein